MFFAAAVVAVVAAEFVLVLYVFFSHFAKAAPSWTKALPQLHSKGFEVDEDEEDDSIDEAFVDCLSLPSAAAFLVCPLFATREIPSVDRVHLVRSKDIGSGRDMLW